MPNWNVASTFEIISIGDADLLASALNGLAAITSSDSFGRLVQAAFLVGILVFAGKSVFTSKFELTTLLASMILYIIMFGAKGTVVVVDGYSGATRVVANVPIGIAAPYSMVSAVGRYMSKTFEQAFATANLGSDMTTDGYLDSLSVLLKMRDLSLGSASSTGTGNNDQLDKSVINYIASCVIFDIESTEENPDKITEDKIKRAPSLWYALKTTYPNIYVRVFTPSTPPGGQLQSCRNAWVSLNPYFNPDANTAYANGPLNNWLLAILPKSLSGSPTAGARAQLALNAIGLGSKNAADYAMNSVLYRMYRDAKAANSATVGDVNAAITLSQAELQRNTEWATEKTMFEKVARPVTAFIEVFLVAATPIMAIGVCALGVAGVSTFAKFLMLHLWVSLWVPTMAICNMFINSRVNAFIEHMQVNTWTGPNAMDALSIYSLDEMTLRLQNEYATGCMLAAATPMLTLLLLTGSSQVASMVASKMSGSGSIDPTVASPAAFKSAPVVSNGSIYSGSAVGAYNFAGRGSMTSSVSRSALAQEQSASDQVMSTGRDFAASLSASVSSLDGKANTYRWDKTNGLVRSDGTKDAYATTFGLTAETASNNTLGASINSSVGKSFTDVVAQSLSGGMGLSTDLKGAAKKWTDFVKGAVDFNRGDSSVTQLATQAGVNADQAYSWLQSARQTFSNQSSNSRDFGRVRSDSEMAAYGVQVSNTQSDTQQAASQQSYLQSFQARETHSQALQNVALMSASATANGAGELYHQMSGHVRGEAGSGDFDSKVGALYARAFNGDTKLQDQRLNEVVSSPVFRASVGGMTPSQVLAAGQLQVLAMHGNSGGATAMSNLGSPVMPSGDADKFGPHKQDVTDKVKSQTAPVPGSIAAAPAIKPAAIADANAQLAGNPATAKSIFGRANQQVAQSPTKQWLEDFNNRTVAGSFWTSRQADVNASLHSGLVEGLTGTAPAARVMTTGPAASTLPSIQTTSTDKPSGPPQGFSSPNTSPPSTTSSPPAPHTSSTRPTSPSASQSPPSTNAGTSGTTVTIPKATMPPVKFTGITVGAWGSDSAIQNAQNSVPGYDRQKGRGILAVGNIGPSLEMPDSRKARED